MTRTIEERTLNARAKLALVLGAMQGNAMREERAHIAPDAEMLSAVVNGQRLVITWRELALCAGADRYGGPDDEAPAP